MNWEDELKEKLLQENSLLMIKEVIPYVKSLLKKQREICADEYKKKFYSQMNPMSYGDIMNSILNMSLTSPLKYLIQRVYAHTSHSRLGL